MSKVVAISCALTLAAIAAASAAVVGSSQDEPPRADIERPAAQETFGAVRVTAAEPSPARADLKDPSSLLCIDVLEPGFDTGGSACGPVEAVRREGLATIHVDRLAGTTTVAGRAPDGAVAVRLGGVEVATRHGLFSAVSDMRVQKLDYVAVSGVVTARSLNTDIEPVR